MDRIAALRLAGSIAVAYPGRTVTDDHARSWARELERLTESQGERVVAMLTSRSIDPPSRAQLVQAVDEVLERVRREVSSAKFDPFLCTFADGIVCKNCSMYDPIPVVHGHLLAPAELAANLAGLRERLKAEPIGESV